MADLVEQKIFYSAENVDYAGLLLQARGREPHAAVVLLPDWRGQSELARDHAHYLVELNCAVVIADLYGGGLSPTDPNQVGPMVKRLVEKRESGVKALQACVDVLKTQLPVPIFCLGYSAGGMIALDYGRSGAKIAGIILCSALLKSAEQGKNTKIASPVLILLGTQDVVSPMSVINDVIAEMDQAGNNFRFELYGQTHHAFDNPEAGMDPNARLVYSPSSARRARYAIAEFIAEHSN